VVVVGGGHAGVEAALAASRTGVRAVLVTAEPDRIAVMPCNPAIGGVAKGCLVREIDALGGAMATAADEASVQFRMLNLRKGPAVWGPRVQADSDSYPEIMAKILERSRVEVIPGMATALEGGPSRFTGVILKDRTVVPGEAFVLATGTYLGGVLFRGDEKWPGGRAGGLASAGMDRFISGMFHVERFKTGTSPRVVTSSVRLGALEPQESHESGFRFSIESPSYVGNAMRCYLARTNGVTAAAVRENLGRSPLYRKIIGGRGPRYCPSFEDKVVKFPDRLSHPVHLEPVSRRSRLSYLNGLSTSLPQDVQYRMLRSIPGFERAEIALFGYAVEYTRLSWGTFDGTLKLSGTENLFAAGQILGTSGYEEAAALGLLAGANAGRVVRGEEPLVPDPEESYLGVMVQDLVQKGIDEPYRLFSGRAGNRLHLRQDNAHLRMMDLGVRLGVLGGRRLELAEEFRREWRSIGGRIREKGLEGMCRRPETRMEDIATALDQGAGRTVESLRTAFYDIRYSGYLARHRRRAIAVREQWGLAMPCIPEGGGGISIEARQAIEMNHPTTLEDAARLPGVRASDMEALLLLALKKRCST
jgi:tRNA uridine 5-carboxymethylaminomethyl modification enzyme